jgi:predicted SprT family Zn-dependent metalloprotease
MATPKRPKPQRETIACCRACQRTHIMRGTAAQLKREGAMRCPRCKGTLAVVMEVERL